MGCSNVLSMFFVYYLFILQYTSAQEYVYHFCLVDNYTTSSTFQSNLNFIFSTLSLDSNDIIDNAYLNNTIGETPDTVYGSLQCRPNLSSICPACVKMAIQEIKRRCPNSEQAIIWYDTCMFRYSDQFYFNIMQDRPGVYLWNVNNVSVPDQFTPVVGELLNDLVGKAVSSSLLRNFASDERNVTSHTKVYAFVQCTADISASNCRQCLLGAISELPNCCDEKSGARIIRPSCNFRYELYPFLGDTTTPSPPLLSSPAPLISPPPPISPPPSTNSTAPNSNRNNTPILGISIVVPMVIVVLSAITFWFFCLRRKKTKTKYIDGKLAIPQT
ncbi:hypothetical protein MKW94_005333 [Papaver nudicaule]|uniref:Gnk2-homologous domain-containing protein n=1 Tax=Papaver nudicaule TaxID=74823 RepID=A0AA42B5C6_PAPNU|nr:hypothetical protein [Papaver nudicaule]